ncbi:MAG: hypothetical protein IPG50_02260 [Myxococcales bacterium]|nr:hypothetical protein [Myxococcales bacterium]
MEHAIPLIVRLYEIVDELERLYPGRHFTPDGHMVGSIGEAWAQWVFDLDLLPASAPTHDARAKDGRLVQVKATQGKAVALSSEPDYLIVLKLARSGHAEVVYNGPGAEPWLAAGKPAKTGQRPLSLSKLRALDARVPVGQRFPVVRCRGAA